MANISLTYTLTNGTTADASQVMQNYADLVNGTSDGTKDFSISALTCAGTATLNGNVTLGNSTSDDITVTGSLASSIPVKTNTTYNIGTATLGLLSVYIGGTSTYTTRILGAATSTWTLTLPVDSGSSGRLLRNGGSGTTTWGDILTTVAAATNSAQTLTNTSEDSQLFSPSASHDVVLPTTGVLKGRKFTIINNTTYARSTMALLTIKSSAGTAFTHANGANKYGTIGNGYIEVVALQDTPTTPAHWLVTDLKEEGNYSISTAGGTIDNTTNVTSAATGADTSSLGIHYSRNLDVVSCAGVLDIDATSSGGKVLEGDFTLPITATFPSSSGHRFAGGGIQPLDAISGGTDNYNGGIYSVASSSKCHFKLASNDGGASTGWAVQFQYWIQT